jgi:GMP synthase-like glutamine amidotransferase
MRPLYIFRHIACEGPGYLAEVLARHNVPSRLIRIDAGDRVPDSLEGCSGLVFMGGSMSVNDPLPWLEQELSLIRAARAIDMPVLGHCLGGQLISKALGGEITRNPVKEIGWHPVRGSNTAGAAHWLDGPSPSRKVPRSSWRTTTAPTRRLPSATRWRCNAMSR